MREWLRRNVVFVVLADVILSLVLFGVVNSGQAKSDCYASVFDKALSNHPPSRAQLEDQARGCSRLGRF